MKTSRDLHSSDHTSGLACYLVIQSSSPLNLLWRLYLAWKQIWHSIISQPCLEMHAHTEMEAERVLIQNAGIQSYTLICGVLWLWSNTLNGKCKKGLGTMPQWVGGGALLFGGLWVLFLTGCGAFSSGWAFLDETLGTAAAAVGVDVWIPIGGGFFWVDKGPDLSAVTWVTLVGTTNIGQHS